MAESESPTLFDEAEDGTAEGNDNASSVSDTMPLSSILRPLPATTDAAKVVPSTEVKTMASHPTATAPPVRKDAGPWTPDTIMTFGKYKGLPARDVPVFYFRFLANFDWNSDAEAYVRDPSKELSFFGRKSAEYLKAYRLCFHCGQPMLVESDHPYNAHATCRAEKVAKDRGGGRGQGGGTGRGRGTAGRGRGAGLRNKSGRVAPY